MIEEALRSIIIADEDVTALIGDRCYGVKMPQSPTLPLAVMTRVSSDPGYHLSAQTNISMARIQIDSWGASLSEARDLAEAVRLAISAYRGTGPSLLTNPGFELGDTGWTKTSGGTIAEDSTTAKSGSWRGKLDGTDGASLSQIVTASDDCEYSWSVQANVVSAPDTRFRIRALFRDSGGGTLLASDTAITETTSGYERFTTDGQAAPSGTASILFDLRNQGAGGEVYVDECLLVCRSSVVPFFDRKVWAVFLDNDIDMYDNETETHRVSADYMVWYTETT
jgi:hypothetical protein